MITPIITSLSREALTTVAQDDKNGALAMGATRWEMLRVAVFPRVRSGLIGAAMLGLGRAMGETIAVALVLGSSARITSHLFRPGDSMASVIVHEFPEATGLHRAALIGLGVVLFVITIVVNMFARVRRQPHLAHARDHAMTAVETPAPPGDRPIRPTGSCSGRSRPGAGSSTACASAWMIGSLLVRARARRRDRGLRREQGRGRHELDFLTKDLPIVTQFPGGGIGPAIVGTLVITGVAALMAIPLGVLAAVYLNEYGRPEPHRPGDPVHGRRHDRRAVDRDGSVRRDDLGERRAALRVLGLRGFARARPR